MLHQWQWPSNAVDALSWCLEIGGEQQVSTESWQDWVRFWACRSWGYAIFNTGWSLHCPKQPGTQLGSSLRFVTPAQRAFAQHTSVVPIPGLVYSAHTHSCPGHLPSRLYQGLPLNSIYKLQLVQNAAPWAVMCAPGAARVTPLHEQHQLPVWCIASFMAWGQVIWEITSCWLHLPIPSVPAEEVCCGSHLLKSCIW